MVNKERKWLSLMFSPETGKRIVFLMKFFGENRSATIKRCIDIAYEKYGGK